MSYIRSRNELKDIFDQIDLNKNGELDFEEVAELARRLGITDCDASYIRDFFQKIDINYDKKVSFGEFVAWYRIGQDSKLKLYLQNQLRYTAGFSHLKTKFKDQKISELTEDNTYIEIADKDLHEKSKISFFAAGHQLPDRVTELRNAFGSTFGEAEITGMCYFKIKGKNPEKLTEAFSSFFETLKQSLIEILPELSEYFESQIYKVIKTDCGVIIGFDVLNQAMVTPQIESMYSYIESTLELKPKTKFDISLGADLHTVKAIHSGEGNLLTEIAKEIKILLRVKAKGNVMAQNLEIYRILKGEELKQDKKHSVQVFNLLFHSQKFRMILNKADNYEILKKQCNGVDLSELDPEYPDLVEFIWDQLDDYDFYETFKKYPFAQELIEVVKEEGIADVVVGLALPNQNVELNAMTAGVKELWADVEQMLKNPPQ